MENDVGLGMLVTDILKQAGVSFIFSRDWNVTGGLSFLIVKSSWHKHTHRRLVSLSANVANTEKGKLEFRSLNVKVYPKPTDTDDRLCNLLVEKLLRKNPQLLMENL